MTLPVQQPVDRYTGNGVTTIFPYSFGVETALDIEVYIGPSKIANYSVDLNLSQVTITPAPENGAAVEIWRVVPIEQTTNYEARDPFPAETHEGALDRRTMIDQQLAEQFKHTLGYDPKGNVSPSYDAQGNRIVNLADPAAPQDPVTRAWMEANGYGTGTDGPPGEAGPTAFGLTPKNYAELQDIAAPLDEELATVTDPGIYGTFRFSSAETRGTNGGTIFRPNDGTPGAWVRQ